MRPAALLLARAAAIPTDDLLWTAAEVKTALIELAEQIDVADPVDAEVGRLPLVGPELAEAVGRLLFRGEAATSDYGRCVQVSQLLGDAANRLDVVGDFTRSDLLRQHAHAVSLGGNAL